MFSLMDFLVSKTRNVLLLDNVPICKKKKSLEKENKLLIIWSLEQRTLMMEKGFELSKSN